MRIVLQHYVLIVTANSFIHTYTCTSTHMACHWVTLPTEVARAGSGTRLTLKLNCKNHSGCSLEHIESSMPHINEVCKKVKLLYSIESESKSSEMKCHSSESFNSVFLHVTLVLPYSKFCFTVLLSLSIVLHFFVCTTCDVIYKTEETIRMQNLAYFVSLFYHFKQIKKISKMVSWVFILPKLNIYIIHSE